MGDNRTYYGAIPAEWVTDPAKVREILDARSGLPSPEDNPADRYPDPITWVEMDGGLSVLATTKNWESWVEESLKAIASHVAGQHEIQVDGEEGDHWVLVLRRGTLYEQALVHEKAGRPKIWTG
jgi:hypothetical protein